MSVLRKLMRDYIESHGVVKAFVFTWKRYFRGILPAVDEVFFRVKVVPF